jgi:hypothetical protein
LSEEPQTQPGKTMGLSVLVDVHSDLAEFYSLESDFDSMTAIIKFQGEIPLTYHHGFK